LPLLDDSLVEYVKALDAISAIAISHPHYYSSMVEWSRVAYVRRASQVGREEPKNHSVWVSDDLQEPHGLLRLRVPRLHIDVFIGQARVANLIAI